MSTWKETKNKLRRDKQRLREFLAQDPVRANCWLWTQASYQAVYLSRVSHHLFIRGHRLLARLMWHLNVFLTGADINPISDIGPGFVMLHPMCVIIVGKIGSDFTIHSHGGVGGGMSKENIGAGPGLPVIGDNVTLGHSATILGPIRIGHNTIIEPRSFIHKNVNDNSLVQSVASKVINLKEREVVHVEVA